MCVVLSLSFSLLVSLSRFFPFCLLLFLIKIYKCVCDTEVNFQIHFQEFHVLCKFASQDFYFQPPTVQESSFKGIPVFINKQKFHIFLPMKIEGMKKRM